MQAGRAGQTPGCTSALHPPRSPSICTSAEGEGRGAEGGRGHRALGMCCGAGGGGDVPRETVTECVVGIKPSRLGCGSTNRPDQNSASRRCRPSQNCLAKACLLPCPELAEAAGHWLGCALRCWAAPSGPEADLAPAPRPREGPGSALARWALCMVPGRAQEVLLAGSGGWVYQTRWQQGPHPATHSWPMWVWIILATRR